MVATTNADIAAMLRRMADVRRLEGANTFQVGAYTKAARAIEQHPSPVVEMTEPQLMGIRGVGKAIASKVVELCVEGSVLELEQASDRMPLANLDELMAVPGIGPVRAKKLIEMGITDRHSLRVAVENGTYHVADVPRMLASIDFAERENERLPVYSVMRGMLPMVTALRAHADALDFAGSVRRHRETVKDVDLVAHTTHPSALIRVFCEMGETISAGDAKASIFVKLDGSRVRCDLLIVDASCYGSALNHFTGSKEHNVALRTLARAQGLTVSEFGIFRGEERVGGGSEHDLYDILGVPYHPPELREGPPWPEIPSDLVSMTAVRDDLHSHTVHSDGQHTVLQMAMRAREMGLRSLGVSDHMARSAIGSKLFNEPGRLAERHREIADARAQTGLNILSGVEVDIATDGSLEMPDGPLPDLDYVMASIHVRPDRDLGARTLAAIRSGRVDIIGHCTGRAFGRRPSAEGVDWSLLFREAARAGVAFEVNGQGDRLDPPPELIRLGIQEGVRFMPCSDAHSVEQLSPCLRQAVAVCRRAGLRTSQTWLPGMLER